MVAIILVINGIYGCSGNTKEAYIDDLKSFVGSVSSTCKNYTEQEWKKADIKVNQFIQTKDTKFNLEFTEAERSEVNQLLGKYTALRLKFEMGKIKGEFNDAIDQVKGIVTELKSDSV